MLQIENIHSTRRSIRRILNGYAPRDEEKSHIYGIKRGLDFIADRDNIITEKNQAVWRESCGAILYETT